MTAADTLQLTWYDGETRPPADVIALLAGAEFPDQGSILIGTNGVLVLPHGSRPGLLPDEKFKDHVLPRVKGLNHWELFVEACRGNGETNADFAYAGPLTEAILPGGIASRFPKTTLAWNSPELKFDLTEANLFVRQDYRKGWELP